MKKYAAAALLLFSSSAMAEFDASNLSIGAGYGFAGDGVLSLRGDYDLSGNVNQPVKIRVGYDNYSESYSYWWGSYKWNYNVFYAGAYYDFNKAIGMGDKIHPFAGLGFGFGSVSCSVSGVNCGSSPTVGGLYYIAGLQYDITERFSAEASISAWGGLTLGANFNF